MSLLPPGLEERLLERLRSESRRLYEEKTRRIDEAYRRGLGEVRRLLDEAVERFCENVAGSKC